MSFQTLQPRQRQQHTVTPRLQHAVRLLQLSSLDFAQEVQDAMGRNPFLEVEDTPHDAGRVDIGPASSEGEPRGIDLEAMAPIAMRPTSARTGSSRRRACASRTPTTTSRRST
jgi:DNA-directed RNA polymerase specialized sigma subunit, sigma54 homolog